MTENYALKWLHDAQRAPSGGNAQPWKVSYAEDTTQVAFELSIDPLYLQNISPMDIKGAASALALGCFSLNLQILAQHDGFTLVNRGIDEAGPWTEGHVVLVFQKMQVKAPRWSVDDVRNRRTNRTAYIKKEIPIELLNSMTELACQYTGLKVQQFRETKNQLIPALAILERIRWQTPILLSGVVKEINFGKDIKLAKVGIPATQLGADLGERGLLRMVRNFPKMGAIFKTPAVDIAVRKGTHNFIREADSVFMLQVTENKFANFLELGECFQSLWLEAHKHGLAFQPTGAPLVALGYWLQPDLYNFKAKQIKELEHATNNFNQEFELDFKKLMMGFRIGYASKETRQAPRKDVEAQWAPELLKAKVTYPEKPLNSNVLMESRFV